jgi:hypothetical protein
LSESASLRSAIQAPSSHFLLALFIGCEFERRKNTLAVKS